MEKKTHLQETKKERKTGENELFREGLDGQVFVLFFEYSKVVSFPAQFLSLFFLIQTRKTQQQVIEKDRLLVEERKMNLNLARQCDDLKRKRDALLNQDLRLLSSEEEYLSLLLFFSVIEHVFPFISSQTTSRREVLRREEERISKGWGSAKHISAKAPPCSRF